MTLFDLGGASNNSFPFEHVGDQVTGTVLELEQLQQTDMQTGELKEFSNGQPMMMYRVSLQTQLRDTPDDDGVRSIYLKGSRKPESQSSLAAVLDAVKKATGGTAIATGGTLTLAYVADGDVSKRGFNPPKLYQAHYQPPTMNLGDDVKPIQPPLAAPQTVPVQQFAPTAQPMAQQPPVAQPAPFQQPQMMPQPGIQQQAPAPQQPIDVQLPAGITPQMLLAAQQMVAQQAAQA